jgi:putative transposase
VSHKAGGYASDLTDEQWGVIEPLIPVYKWGRPRMLDIGQVVNTVLCLGKTGCQWHILSRDYPNPNSDSVYHHFQT